MRDRSSLFASLTASRLISPPSASRFFGASVFAGVVLASALSLGGCVEMLGDVPDSGSGASKGGNNAGPGEGGAKSGGGGNIGAGFGGMTVNAGQGGSG